MRAHGPDAVKFLQGQLSNDVTKLSAGQSLLAGLHNAQGRAIALLRLVLAGPDEVLMIVPRELAAGVAARLVKFVLRSKVKVSDASSEWELAGVVAGSEDGGVAMMTDPARMGASCREEEADGSVSAARVWCASAKRPRDG